MGMQAEFEQIPPSELREGVASPQDFYRNLIADREASLELALPMIMERLEEARANMPPPTQANLAETLKQYQALVKEIQSHPVIRTNEAKGERKKFSLEKDWHVLHYGLNGTVSGGDGPLAQAILGGTEIPDHDHVMGYGPVRYLESQQVKEVAEALATVEPQSVLSKLYEQDATSKQVYLANTLDDLPSWSYLPELFIQFRDFYADAAQHGHGMLLLIV